VEPTSLWLPFNEKRRLHDRAYRAQQRGHGEVCGAVIATRTGRCVLHFIPNRARQHGSFTIRSADIRMIESQLNGSDRHLVAIFHSHPLSDATPSSGDISRMPLKYLQLIYDVCGRTVRLWKVRRVGGQRVPSELPIKLVPRATTERSAKKVGRA
jgi:proteasome lid subunit RPN8/RPN11